MKNSFLILMLCGFGIYSPYYLAYRVQNLSQFNEKRWMMNNLKEIRTDFASLRYTVYPGNGAETLLFFPGFGQNESHYIALVTELSQKYSVIVIHLFFHGESQWFRPEVPMEVEEWRILMNRLSQQENLQRIRLMGFSMGARFAMLTYEFYSGQVDELILAAPDGIALNIWYRIAVGNKWFRKLFKSVVLTNVSSFRKIAERFSVMGLLDKKIYRFSFSQLQTQEQRERVFFSWVVFRKIQVNIPQLTLTLNKKHTPVLFYLGDHDKIITRKRITPLHSRLHSSTLVVLSSGHTHLLEAIAKDMGIKEEHKS